MMAKHPYPDHGSPARAARVAARRNLPCPDCGSTAEPTIRRARPFSIEWESNRDAFFGCRDCGLDLAGLSGPAAMRPSDRPLDHVPEPEGTLVRLLEDETVRRLVSRASRGDEEAGAIDLGHIYPGLGLRPNLTVTFETRPLLVIEPEDSGGVG